MKILVFDVGGTSIKYGFCLDGQLMSVREIPTEAKKGGRHIMDTLRRLIREQSGFDAIGISTACIVLGGGIMVQPLIMELLRQKLSRYIMPSFAHVDIRPAELGNSAGLLGAFYLAAQQVQANR